MKQAKKLTREQKQIVSANHLNSKHWMFVEDLGSYIKIINKETSHIKMVTKFPRKETSHYGRS